MISAGTVCRALEQGLSDRTHLLEYCCLRACFVDQIFLSPKQLLGISYLHEKWAKSWNSLCRRRRGCVWGREEEAVWDTVLTLRSLQDRSRDRKSAHESAKKIKNLNNYTRQQQNWYLLLCPQNATSVLQRKTAVLIEACLLGCQRSSSGENLSQGVEDEIKLPQIKNCPLWEGRAELNWDGAGAEPASGCPVSKHYGDH